MHAFLWRHRVSDPARRDEVVWRARAGLVPLLASLQGVMQTWIVAVEHDEVMCIAFFSEARQARACSVTAAAWIDQSLGPLLAGPVDTAVGQVISGGLATGPRAS